MLFRKFSFLLIVGMLFYGCGTTRYEEPMPSKTQTAKPKPGTKSPATMRPYSINGKTYYPQIVSVGDKQKGIASWYGPNFHGKSTSNGERYDMHSMTAAHKTYPMNTMVKVTNLRNNRSAVVRINDRGPFVDGRVIDLSKKVAMDLDVHSTGTAPVMLEVVGFSGHAVKKGSAEATYVGGNFMVQIGAFKRYEGALSYKREYDNTSGYKTIIKKYDIDDGTLHRVFLSGFKSEDEARDFARGGPFAGAFIVRE